MRRTLPLFILLSSAVAASSGLKAGAVCGAPSRGNASAFVVVDRRTPADTLATITVCLVSDTARFRLAGYHGEVSLSKSARVVHVDRSPGGARIENTSVPGRVSFAGVVSSGLTSGALLALTVARADAADDSRMRLTMLDVTDIDGHDVAARIRVDSMPRSTRKP
jgi:hypothetical protein